MLHENGRNCLSFQGCSCSNDIANSDFKVSLCTNHVVYLLNAHFFGFSRSLVKSLSDWFFYFFVSSLLEVFQSVKIFLNVNNVLLRSLFTLVSLFWVPVSTRSLVSFHSNAESSFLMITNIHNS